MRERWRVLGLLIVSLLVVSSGLAAGNTQVLLPLVLTSSWTPAQPALKYVVSTVHFPHKSSEDAYDLNGDGQPDDQWGQLVGGFQGTDTDIDGNEQAAIAAGTIVQLATLASTDPTLMNDPHASTTLLAGVSQKTDFSGAGHFVVDPTIPGGTANGTLASGIFASADPATTSTPTTYLLKIAFMDTTPVVLPLNGVHIRWQAQSGPPARLVAGQINGSIKETDIQKYLVPAIARALTAIVQANPPKPSSMQLESLFDGGGCTNPDGSKAQAHDKIIDPCEVSQNAEVGSLLAPDVQIYDAIGKYAPNPANTKPDSFSFGFAFEAVQAQY